MAAAAARRRGRVWWRQWQVGVGLGDAGAKREEDGVAAIAAVRRRRKVWWCWG